MRHPQEGRIKPWFNAEIKPYCGETTFRLNDDGLIFEHLETWDVSHLLQTLHSLCATTACVLLCRCLCKNYLAYTPSDCCMQAPAYDVFLSVFSKNFGVPPCPPVAGVQT